MEIKIKETNEIKTLKLIDPKTGCDWIKDFLGNNGADINYDDDDNAVMSADDFKWWSDAVDRQSEIDDLYEDNRYNDDFDHDSYADCFDNDLEMSQHRALIFLRSL